MRAKSTQLYRTKVAAAAAGQRAMPTPAYVAYGTGGWSGSVDNPVPPGDDDVALDKEAIRKPITQHDIQRQGAVVKIVSRVSGAEMDGIVTEAGIIDSDGDLIGRATFRGKGLEPGTTLDVELELVF